MVLRSKTPATYSRFASCSPAEVHFAHRGGLPVLFPCVFAPWELAFSIEEVNKPKEIFRSRI